MKARSVKITIELLSTLPIKEIRQAFREFEKDIEVGSGGDTRVIVTTVEAASSKPPEASK